MLLRQPKSVARPPSDHRAERWAVRRLRKEGRTPQGVRGGVSIPSGSYSAATG